MPGTTTLNPKFIERVTGKLKDESILSELSRHKITPKGTARSRKTQLQAYLIKRYTNPNGESWVNGAISEIDKQASTASSKSKKKKMRRLQRSILELSHNTVGKISQISEHVDEDPPREKMAKEVVPGSPRKKNSAKPEPSRSCECLTQPIRTLETGLLKIQQRVSDVEGNITHSGSDDLTAKFEKLERDSNTLLSAFNEQQSIIDTLVCDVIHLKSSQSQDKTVHPHTGQAPELQESTDDNLEAESRIAVLEKRLSDMGRENSMLTKKFSVAEEKLDNYEMCLQNKNKENIGLQALLSEKESTCKRLNSELSNSEKHRESIRKELVETISKLEYSEAEVLTLKNERSDLHKVIVEQEVRYCKLRDVAPSPKSQTDSKQVQLIHIDKEGPSSSGIIQKSNPPDPKSGQKAEKEVSDDKYPRGKGKQAKNPAEPPKSVKGSSSQTESAKKHSVSNSDSFPEQETANNTPLWKGDQTESDQNHRTRTHPTKCLLVHDEFHLNFDKHKFSSDYDISAIAMYRTKHILQSGSMVSKIKALKPESTILHIGHRDLWDGKTPEDVLNDVKQIVYKVMENTSTKLCISLVIPVTAHSFLNQQIKSYNEDLARFIGSVRRNSDYSNRLFTTDNRKLTDYLKKSVGTHGSEVKLTDKGENILWLLLKDSFDRSLGRYRRYETQRDSYRRSYNRNQNNND